MSQNESKRELVDNFTIFNERQNKQWQTTTNTCRLRISPERAPGRRLSGGQWRDDPLNPREWAKWRSKNGNCDRDTLPSAYGKVCQRWSHGNIWNIWTSAWFHGTLSNVSSCPACVRGQVVKRKNRFWKIIKRGTSNWERNDKQEQTEDGKSINITTRTNFTLNLRLCVWQESQSKNMSFPWWVTMWSLRSLLL